MHLLLVEDDLDLGSQVEDFLKINNFNITWVTDGATALKTIQIKDFDLIILDIQLPDFDGFYIANLLSKNNKGSKFLFLTALANKENVIKGLKLGAEDYLNKPFDLDIFLLKINRILDVGSLKVIDSIVYGDVKLDLKLRLLIINDNQFPRLTEREFFLWKYLLENAENVLLRTDILLNVWGDDDYFLGRSLDVFVSKFRKLLLLSNSVKLETVYKTGFILNIVT